MKRFALLSLCLPALLASARAGESLLNNDWKFLRLDEGVADPADAPKPGFDASGWESVTLPHTVRIESPETSSKPFQGKAWYRRVVTASPDMAGKRVSLFFEGAMQVAEVWVDGVPVAKHEGGYLPFTVDLTDALAKDGKAVVTVRVDNTDQPLIPPGKPNAKLDFCYFGGIYRNVRLRVTDPVHLTDAVAAKTVAGGGVFARYENVSEAGADIRLSAQIKNEAASAAGTSVRFTLRDAGGKVAGTASAGDESLAPGAVRNVAATIALKSPKLWHPDSPYRYTLVTEVLRDGKVVDTDETKLGVRSLAFDNAGFHLNGKPYVLRGANRHQDYPWLGNAVPDNASYRDIRLMKEAGYNFLRLAHYPQSQAVMDACDELGVMVSVCTPGWQYFNKNEIFKNHARQNIRDMVRWHRNHPSVAMWEVTLNETYGSDEFYAECAVIAHDEYPGDQMLTSGDTYASKAAGFLDIPYPVWTDKGNVANKTAKWTKAFAREYGDYNFGGLHSTSRVPLGAGEEALLLQAWNHQWSHNANLGSPWFGGDCLWAGIDNASSSGAYAKDRPVSWWGPLDYYRLPKFSYRFFQSQQSATVTPVGVGSGPVTFIANYWTPRTSPAKVVVYSNGDEVELFLNGKSLGRRKPDNGPDSKYGEWRPDADVVYMATGADYASDAAKTAAQVAAHKAKTKGKKEKAMFDGGNARLLDHAPFTFPGLTYAPGELRAVSYAGGKQVSEFIRRTPGKPASLRIEVAEDGRPLAAGGSDAVFIRAVVLDANGTVVPENAPAVKFTVTGAARLVSVATPETEAGIASGLIVSTGTAGTATVTAESPGLPAAKFDYAVKP